MNYLECPLHSTVQVTPSKNAQDFIANCKNCSIKENCDHLKQVINTFGEKPVTATSTPEKAESAVASNEELWAKNVSAHRGEYIRNTEGNIGRVVRRIKPMPDNKGQLPITVNYQNGSSLCFCYNYDVLHGCPSDVGINESIDIKRLEPTGPKEISRIAKKGDYVKVIIESSPTIVKVLEVISIIEDNLFVIAEEVESGIQIHGPLYSGKYVVLEGYKPRLAKMPKKQKTTWSESQIMTAFAWVRSLAIVLMDAHIYVSFHQDNEELSCYIYTPEERVRDWVKRYHEEDSDNYDIACMFALEKTLRKGHIFERYLDAENEPALPEPFKLHSSDTDNHEDCADGEDGNEPIDKPEA